MTAIAALVAWRLAALPPVAQEPSPEPTLPPQGGDGAAAESDAAVSTAVDGASSNDSALAPEPVPSPRVAPPDGGEPQFVREGGIPGGYWDLDAARGREPPDGDEQIIVGSILLPIGLITASSAAGFIWLSQPGACADRWAGLGASPTPQQCRGLYGLGWARVAYGSLAAVTGAALLGIGLVRREKHRRWKRGIAFSPWISRGGGGLSLMLRR